MFVRVSKRLHSYTTYFFMLMILNEVFLSIIIGIFLFCFKEISASIMKSLSLYLTFPHALSSETPCKFSFHTQLPLFLFTVPD